MAIPVFETTGKEPVRLFDLTRKNCRCPLDERSADGFIMFCGAEKERGSSYCPYHHELFTQLPHLKVRANGQTSNSL